MCLSTPQQGTNVARPRPVLRVRSSFTPLGFGCARLATLAFAPPHPKGVKLEGRKTNYRSRFTPAITSNLVFSKWDQIFKDPMTTMAAIDRLVHHSLILEFTGESVRAQKAQVREQK